MKTITLDLIRSFGPCYDPSKYVSNPNWKGDVIKVLNNPNVPAADKIWLVVRPEFMSDKLLHIFACEVAEQALKQHNIKNKRSWKAIQVKRLWLEGKATDQELRLAREQAWQAYAAAAADAATAYAAARAAAAAAAAADAATYAAADAATAAAAAAAADATDAAAAAKKAERERQICVLIKLIEEHENE